MNKTNTADIFLDKLKEENPQYKQLEKFLPEKEKLIRSLMNIRMPKTISDGNQSAARFLPRPGHCASNDWGVDRSCRRVCKRVRSEPLAGAGRLGL